MNQKLSEWASIAEIVAAIGIIVSLIFVGLQINDGNRETRAATIQSALDTEVAVNAELLRYADVWQKVSSGRTFSDDVERREAILLFNTLMTMLENQYFQFESGFLETPPDMTILGTLPFYGDWRETGGARQRSPEFLEYVDNSRERRAAE